MRDIALVNREMKDLNPLILGEEQCPSGHTFGPHVRSYTLIHFIVRGKGVFLRDGTTYSLGEGDAFIIRPDEVTTYYADGEDPWYYQWIGFDGALTERFSQIPPIVKYQTNWAERMLSIADGEGLVEYRIAALLFEMYAELFTAQKPQNHYVRRVQNYIDSLYMQPIRIESIAEMMNLDRRYLSRLFKARTGKTIQAYLVEIRMEAAKRELEKGNSVNDTARLVGYDDVCNFSKMFKHQTGISPGRWKKGTVAST